MKQRRSKWRENLAYDCSKQWFQMTVAGSPFGCWWWVLNGIWWDIGVNMDGCLSVLLVPYIYIYIILFLGGWGSIFVV
jgi:hypothetical protein